MIRELRDTPLTHFAIEFEQEEDPSSRSFFSEIISSISDVRFSHDGRYILSRDYLTVKIWDVNMERQPVKTIPIHEHLRPRLCDTYENDSIFDKFEVVFSGDAKNVMTGSYNNNFMIYPSDPDKEVEVVLQADKSAFKAKKVGIPTPINSSASPTSTNGSKKGGSRAGSPAAGAPGQGGRMRKETDADQIDFNKKILHMSWHPFEDSIAIAATNNVSMALGRGLRRLANSALALCVLCIVEMARYGRIPWVYCIGVSVRAWLQPSRSFVPGFPIRHPLDFACYEKRAYSVSWIVGRFLPRPIRERLVNVDAWLMVVVRAVGGALLWLPNSSTRHLMDDRILQRSLELWAGFQRLSTLVNSQMNNTRDSQVRTVVVRGGETLHPSIISNTTGLDNIHGVLLWV